MRCAKATYPDEATAAHYCQQVAEDNGHAMRFYQCRHCGLWHLTSQVEGVSRVLAWKSPEQAVFVARHGSGHFVVRPVTTTGGWMAQAPDGSQRGPFVTKLLAKAWCEAASFLPPDRWPTC